MWTMVIYVTLTAEQALSTAIQRTTERNMMPRSRNPYNVWLLLFTIGIGLNTLGIAIMGPTWLRYGFITLGIFFLLLSIAVAGRLQRSE